MFSVSLYQELIRNLLQSGLIPSTDWNAELSSRTLLLRHDIDFSVDCAHQLAQVESQLGVTSTFFFMLSSNMYNLFSQHNKFLVREIANMGHRVSIHFDPTVYQSPEEFKNEKKFFEAIINEPVEIVSIHRPGPFLENNDISLCDETPQTYQDIYFREMKYLSDSGGRNLFPLIREYLKDDSEKGLHLLVHPIWWVRSGKNPTATLNNWRNEHLDFITSEIKKNCKTYKG